MAVAVAYCSRAGMKWNINGTFTVSHHARREEKSDRATWLRIFYTRGRVLLKAPLAKVLRLFDNKGESIDIHSPRHYAICTIASPRYLREWRLIV